MRPWSLMVALLATASGSLPVFAQTPGAGGPYNATFLEDGIGIERELLASDPALPAGAAWTISAWVKPKATRETATLITVGEGQSSRKLALRNGRALGIEGEAQVAGGAALAAGRWTHLVATSDGRIMSLYVDGRRVARGQADAAPVTPMIAIAPAEASGHFGGTLVHAAFASGTLGADDVAALVHDRPNFDVVQLWNVGVGWEWQNRANTGLWRQQDAWTLPQARGDATSAPVARPVADRPPLERQADGRWIVHNWTLAAAPDVREGGATLSRPSSASGTWHHATVPGTVLTTLVDRGVYPHPYYGLNNLQIPEELARQDYWYRTSFTVPPEAAGRRLTLQFGGINYASEIWINGQPTGTTKGAFIRGQFAFDPVAGENTVAVRVSPPPHPGIPHEQSISGGVGENGGQMAIDGPTFVATEGWDWIPGIRDRNTGLWRPVELLAHGDVRILDPQIVTNLPLPRIDSADVHLTVPVENSAGEARQVTVRATFDGVQVEKAALVPAGRSDVVFTPAEFPALRVSNPRLWWPNGYGEPALHDIELTVLDSGVVSDSRTERFGIREVSYDLSLFDAAGSLRRVNVQTTDGMLAGEKLVDVRHEAIKQTPLGWVGSLTSAGERSPAVVSVPQLMPEPHLTIRVNGVPIAARGGNWGMDDAMKQVSRERLAPYFRLQREANMNIIRNWMGNNNEDEFFELADENGMMIMNDFWQSTQNFQVEPQDPQLFLTNAVDTVRRYRNHPSIIMWFGRNEGVPYPLLNEGLDDLVAEHDGTRWFTGSSNVVNLQGSGPYNYRPPEGYFTDLATGFSVETGTPSLSTLESVRASVPDSELWPLSDTLAYHDWHFAGNGDTATFMQTLATMFGSATSFEDFERKSQMMNLETHKAMYEGFLGHLWTKNSGRLLWMTHPAWPSNAWQIYSWDYDTHAAYYGAKKATEPLHVQLNLPGNELVVLNTTQEPARGLQARTRIISLDNRELFTRSDPLDAPANQATSLPALPLAQIFERDPMVLISLQLLDASGGLVSENFYWRGRDSAAYRALNALPTTAVASAAAPATRDGEDRLISVTLQNTSQVPALNAKLTLVDERGERILPAYYSDNYVALLPGEQKIVQIRYPATLTGTPSLALRGWNVAETTISVPQ